MTLKEKITMDMKEKLRSGDKLGLSTLRLLMSEVKNAEISKKEELNDDEVLEVINQGVKKRGESIEQFEKGGRADLVEKEAAEAAILRTYLPPQLSEDEIDAIVDEAVAASGAAGVRDIGKVMALVMPKVKGRADGTGVSIKVKEKLGG